MNLRTLAEADLGVILEDNIAGFGYTITVTDPAGTAVIMTGLSNDISQAIDPDTGQAISGRLATAVLRISSLVSAGLGLPVGVADTTAKPWLIAFDDINGNPFVFKVTSSNPDRALGVISLILELYVP